MGFSFLFLSNFIVSYGMKVLHKKKNICSKEKGKQNNLQTQDNNKNLNAFNGMALGGCFVYY